MKYYFRKIKEKCVKGENILQLFHFAYIFS